MHFYLQNIKINTLKFFIFVLFFSSCKKEETAKIELFNNPVLSLDKPSNFPEFDSYNLRTNAPTLVGVEIGKKLFFDKQLSRDNTIFCNSCHISSYAYGDHNSQAIGIQARVGLRNTPPIQNMIFLNTYMWDGAVIDLKDQPIIPIITHEEMDSSISEVLRKIQKEDTYIKLFKRAYPDGEITSERILECLAQFMFTLISANSKYDKIMRNEGVSFSAEEQKGYLIFQQKCASCHKEPLFTDQSFRNIGFPKNPNKIEEKGVARVSGEKADLYRFRVPSLRNIEVTAPYGDHGQFTSLEEVLSYLDQGVENDANLDPYLKENGNRIPLSKEEKKYVISFLKTLTDYTFIKNN